VLALLATESLPSWPVRYDRRLVLEKICPLIMLDHLDRGGARSPGLSGRHPRKHPLACAGAAEPAGRASRLAADASTPLAADAIEAAQQTFETANTWPVGRARQWSGM
jgi:hypothetical protein